MLIMVKGGVEMSDMQYPQQVPCPQCGKLLSSAGVQRPASFPFCQQRCRVLDIGAWSDGGHRIDGDDAEGVWTEEFRM